MYCPMEKLSRDEFLAKMDKSTHHVLCDMATRVGVTHVVLFENLAMDSSHFGARSAMIIGPSCTYKSLAEIKGKPIGQTPSVFKYPVAYWDVKEV